MSELLAALGIALAVAVLIIGVYFAVTVIVRRGSGSSSSD